MTVAPTTDVVDQSALAEAIHRLMRAQGVLFALDAPIRQSLPNLAAFFAVRYKLDPVAMSEVIEAALDADERFIREVLADEVRFVTSRQGGYVPRNEPDTHSFKQRLQDPDHPLPIDDISVVVSTSRPAITTVEPVFISDYWQVQAGLVSVRAEEDALAHELTTLSEPPVVVLVDVPLVVAPTPPLEAPVEAVPMVPTQVAPPVSFTPVHEPVVAPIPLAPPAEVVVPLVVQAAPEPPAPVVVPLPEPVVVTPPPRPMRPQVERGTIFTLADGTPIDLRRPMKELLAEHGATLAQALADKLEHDPLRRIVSFGRRYFPEANVINLGKNDLRKIRDYLLERGGPLLDTELIADVFYHNPRQSDYEGVRFSLNYRLHREKDFEFVGVEGALLWSTKGMPAIGGKRVKAAEMGQITSYLVEGLDDSLQNQSVETIREQGSVTRLLTFFEWEYGVLPLDATLTALLPGPVLPDQRSAVLRFDSPQHYTQALVEVRYPTGNRGGWLQGLEEFFHAHLIPGALITIARGQEPHSFTISYEEASETDDRILTFDEKKNKFAFANIAYFAAVDTDQLPSQSRFGRLNRLKAFPMGERRKAELILEHVIETMGEQVGTRAAPSYTLSFDDLFVGYNTLRPGSRALLQSLLTHGAEFAFDAAISEMVFYTPAPGSKAPAEDEATTEEPTEEPVTEVQPTRRRYGGRYSDDDE